MKKAICVLAMAFATSIFASNDTFAQTQAPAQSTVASEDDGKKERVTAEQLPAEVVSAWTQGPNAKSQVSEINKVTKDDEVWYEVSYADAQGTTQVAKYKADGTEVKKDDKR